ncbi:uncharacterized mitochondrial protein AtMg00300-like [Salvia splendens]|uniref:uncharacterized mitochondrial protein AtMg00300-like n=1 Tax=Salvia splendens TaxID=180675 RepID=UPI001C267ADC|nr:uncharacterized mitochondrial protein AtMg00300-like [Salvia splendens]
MIVSKDEKVLMKAKRKGSLYYMTANIIMLNSSEAHVTMSYRLGVWHARLGHPAMGTVKELAKKGLVQCKDSKTDPTECEECVLGKGKKLPYPKAVHTSSKPLDYAHSDLWGPV